MKKQLLFIALMSWYLASSAQNIQFDWVKQYGGPSYMTVKASNMDPSGAIVTCGHFEGLVDFDPGAGSSPLSSNGQKDAFIAKLNSNGEFAWAVSFGSTLDEIVYDVTTDASGNVFATGEFRGTVNFNPNGTAANLTAFTGYNAFVIKFSSTGEFQWVKKFGGTSSGYESGRAIAMDPNGNVVTHGIYYGVVDFDPGAGVSEVGTAYYYSSYISKLSSNGDYVWAVEVDGTYVTPNELKLDDAGNIYAVGTFYSTTDFNPGAASYSLVGQYYDTYILKLDPNASFIWAKQFTSNNTCMTNEIQIDAAGNVYAAGGFNGTTDFDPDLVSAQTISNSTYTYRPFLVKLNSSGLFQYVKQLSPNSVGQAFGLQIDDQQNLYIAGTFYGTSDFDPDPVAEYPMTSYNNSYDDIFITKLDASANFAQALALGGYYAETVNAMYVNPANGVMYLAGTFQDIVDFDPSSDELNLTSAGYTDGYVLRMVQCSAVESTIQAETCTSYELNGFVYTNTGVYEQVLTASGGCDSILTLELTVLPPTFSNVNLYTTDVITYNGIDYSAEGNYTQVMENSAGCDSTIYIYVDIMQSNFTPTASNGTLTSPQNGTGFQWIDCGNNNTPIPGATNSAYTPTQTGSYAVVVYGNNGNVTSDCIEVIVNSTENLDAAMQVMVYPNPCHDYVSVEWNGSTVYDIVITDALGAICYTQTMNSGLVKLPTSELPAGVYFIQTKSLDQQITTRILKL
ncbi:MAG: T9SS type A sorting domain-containing protein [Flavobacteriales bacterium]|nr:T9SS type A sorting domain-containing protein [Flavobacteriales bacterium]